MLRKSTNYTRFIILLLVVLLVAALLFPELQKRPFYVLSRPVVFVISGLQAGFSWISGGIGGVWTGYINLVSVRRENERIKQDLAQLQNENIRLQEAGRANERLQEFLDLKNRSADHLVAASVIGRDPSNWYRTVKIDKGSRDGIAVDMGVITPVGVVGRVIQTAAGYSQVLLMTDRNSIVAALIQRSRDEGLVEGTEKGSARIKYLSLLADVQAGDLILTSGLTGTFPKGLMIGTIGRITQKEQDLFKEAEVIPVLDFSKIEEVLVVTAVGDRP